jgi:hypothetical protein
MLTLVFAEAGPAPSVKRGPFREVRADGERLRDGEDGPVIARHEDHAWFIGRQRFFRIDCEGPVRVHFEDANGRWSEEFGPFFHFSSADGVAYADGEILAHVDADDCLWYCHRNSVAWREMVVVPAG